MPLSLGAFSMKIISQIRSYLLIDVGRATPIKSCQVAIFTLGSCHFIFSIFHMAQGAIDSMLCINDAFVQRSILWFDFASLLNTYLFAGNIFHISVGHMV